MTNGEARILGHALQDDGSVLVTFAMPGLRRHTIRLSYDAWLAGEHLHIARASPSIVATLFPPVVPVTEGERRNGHDDVESGE